MLVGGWRHPVVDELVMHWPVLLGGCASIALLTAMVVVPASTDPPVPDAPRLWTELVRSGLPRPAGLGCSPRPW